MPTNLTRGQTYAKIRHALDRKRPFSLVRIGDGENVCLAQGSIWSIKRTLKEPWAKRANRGLKGVHLPNLNMRNEMVAEIQKATVVGILKPGDHLIKCPQHLKRPLTNKVFAHFKLSPSLQCDACINRHAPRDKDFWKLLKGRRILLISKRTQNTKSTLERKHGLKIVGTLPFSHYRQINSTLNQVNKLKNSFDIVLISTGVNAVILAPKIARLTGKVALDFGKWHRKI